MADVFISYARSTAKEANRVAEALRGLGYGVWVDTYSDAVFDLNVTDATHIRISVRGKKLRFVLFEGPRFPTILDRFTALADSRKKGLMDEEIIALIPETKAMQVAAD